MDDSTIDITLNMHSSQTESSNYNSNKIILDPSNLGRTYTWLQKDFQHEIPKKIKLIKHN